MNEIIEKAKRLAKRMSFEDCLKLIDQLPIGSPIFDIACDRMEELDEQRYIEWLNA